MSKSWRLWLGFGLVLAALLAATTFLSVTAIRLDRAEMLARQRAAIDERMQLALWRMDSALAPFWAQENAHVYFRADGPFVKSVAKQPDRGSNDASQPPSAIDPAAHVLLRFQIDVDRLAEPPVDPAAIGRFAGSPSQQVDRSDAYLESSEMPALERLSARIPYRALAAKLPSVAGNSAVTLLGNASGIASQAFGNAHDPSQASRASNEFQQRNFSVFNSNTVVQQLSNVDSDGQGPMDTMMTPLWLDGEMVLARRIRRGDNAYIQGSLIDWPSLQRFLLHLIRDLLPEARLYAVESFDSSGEPGLLAALPVRLLPGALPDEQGRRPSALTQSLALAWCAVLLSSLVGGLLVIGIVRLSQRRAAFVAAVTHELRTPLTTFRMYSEMLAQGMVRDPEAQREYLQTLRDQSLRLSHLVENVLAYARLERGRSSHSRDVLTLRELFDPILPRLKQIAAGGNMELNVQQATERDVQVMVDASAVEQILVNLLDNACKYAGRAADRRILLSISTAGRFAQVQVRDYGPGLAPKYNWFRPFQKSAQQAAHSAPGIGLGLALSRRLARQMAGHLQIDHTVTPGAALVLRLPLKRAGIENLP